MRKNLLMLLIATLFITALPVSSQEYDPFIQERVDLLSYDSLYKRMLDFESLGIKMIGSQSLDNTGSWIIEFYEGLGYTNIEIDSFYVGQNLVYNIIVTKTGTVFPDTYLIVDGHYDTYNGPGVNDNGTGTTIVMEVARMMKDLETDYSIKFIHFTAEEIGLVGSTHYVENTVIPQQMDIRLVFNIDEVGGVAGEVNNTITCERDEWAPNQNNAASAAFTDTLAALTEMYSSLETWINYAYGTDYVPFMENGYVITGLYEYNESPWPHSINDSLSRLDPDYVFEVCKASLAASMYFSGATDVGTSTELPNVGSENIEIFPNPFSNYLEVNNTSNELLRLEVLDSYGSKIRSLICPPGQLIRLEMNERPGIYMYRLFDHKGQAKKSGKLISF